MKVVIKKTGEVKEVSDGHARNYLIPKGLAVAATDAAVQAAEEQAATSKQQQAKQREQWANAQKTLSSASITVSAKANDDGTLFAKVPTSAILTAVKEQCSIVLEADWVSMPDDLKHTGEVEVSVAFPTGVTCTFTVHIQAE